MLAVNRLFASERDQGGIDGILLAPIDRTAVFLAKAAALLIYLRGARDGGGAGVRHAAARPRPVSALPALLAVLLLADVGLAVVGALVAALAAETRARDLIIPLLLLPLLVPVMIAGAHGHRAALRGSPGAAGAGQMAGPLGLYDMVFVLVSVGVFDFLLED